MAIPYKTTVHYRIKDWAEKHQGKPAISIQNNNTGAPAQSLDLAFPGAKKGKFKNITWNEFFKAFEDGDLAFIYREDAYDAQNRFFKLVKRDAPSQF